jgi:hypothetical protein
VNTKLIKFIYTTVILFILYSNFITLSAKTNKIFNQEKDGIKISAKILSSKEILKLFLGINIVNDVYLCATYKVLEFDIENKTPNNFLFSRKGLDVPIENSIKIKKMLTPPRILLPLFSGLAISLTLICGIGFAYVPSVIAGIITSISCATINPSSINTITLSNIHNECLDIQHPTLVESFSKIKKIVFIKKKFLKKSINLNLQNYKNKNSSILFLINFS